MNPPAGVVTRKALKGDGGCVGVPRPADNGGPYPPAPTQNRPIQMRCFYIDTDVIKKGKERQMSWVLSDGTWDALRSEAPAERAVTLIKSCECGADAALSVSGRPRDGDMRLSRTNSRRRLESIQGYHLSRANYQQPQPLWNTEIMCLFHQSDRVENPSMSHKQRADTNTNDTMNPHRQQRQ